MQTNYDTVMETFDDMDLKENLIRGVYTYSFESPSAIQQRAIMPCIQGKPSCDFYHNVFVNIWEMCAQVMMFTIQCGVSNEPLWYGLKLYT